MAKQEHSPEEKSKLVFEAIRGERTINEIPAENNIKHAFKVETRSGNPIVFTISEQLIKST